MKIKEIGFGDVKEIRLMLPKCFWDDWFTAVNMFEKSKKVA